MPAEIVEIIEIILPDTVDSAFFIEEAAPYSFYLDVVAYGELDIIVEPAGVFEIDFEPAAAIELEFISDRIFVEFGEETTIDEFVEIGNVINYFSGVNRAYTHDQAVPSNEWIIEHGMGFKPSITIVDSADDVVVGDKKYINDDIVKVFFSNPFSGKAYLS